MRFGDEMVEQEIPKSPKDAYDHEEVEAYKTSRTVNGECKTAMEDAIRKNYDGMRLKTDFIEELVNSFGGKRISYICASTIQESMHDGISNRRILLKPRRLNFEDRDSNS